jgi:hypothetical protein
MSSPCDTRNVQHPWVGARPNAIPAGGVTSISGVCSVVSQAEPTTPTPRRSIRWLSTFAAKIARYTARWRRQRGQPTTELRRALRSRVESRRSDTGPGPDSGLAGRGRGGRAPYVDAENCGNSAASLEIVAAVAASSSASGLRGVPAGNPRALSAALMAGINGADMIASISG